MSGDSGDSADGSDSAGVPGPGVKVEMVLISSGGFRGGA